MSCEVRILPSAEAELDSIVGYLAGLGAQTARRFTEAYRAKLELIASEVVEFGLSRMPELAALGYRSTLVNSYVLLFYYEDVEGLVEGGAGTSGGKGSPARRAVIAHVFHQSQDYARLVLPQGGGAGGGEAEA